MQHHPIHRSLSLVRNFPPQLFSIISNIKKKKNEIIFAHGAAQSATRVSGVSPQLGELTRVDRF